MWSVLTYLSRSKPSQKLLIAVERSEMTFISMHIIANQNPCHDQHNSVKHVVFCPQLIRNVRTRQRIDSASIIAHPVNFDLFRRSLKCDAKNSTYIYIYNHPLDNRYGFLSIRNTKNHVATLTRLEWILKYVNYSCPQADVTRMRTSNR